MVRQSLQYFHFPYSLSSMTAVDISYYQKEQVILEKHKENLAFHSGGTEASFLMSESEMDGFGLENEIKLVVTAHDGDGINQSEPLFLSPYFVLNIGYTEEEPITIIFDNESASVIAHGIPAGGSEGQALVKESNSDYDVSWQTISAQSRYIHEQATAASTWTINHNMNCYPSVTVVDTLNRVHIGTVQYVNTNTLTITFNAAFKGKAYLN